MDLYRHPEKVPLEFFVLRKYITSLLPDRQITIHDRKFLFPLEHLDKSSLSLTDRIDPENQIRFFLSDRTLRKVAELARKIADTGISNFSVELQHSEGILLQQLIRSLDRMQIKITLVPCGTLKFTASLTGNEQQLLAEILKGPHGSEERLTDDIRKIINCGDVFTAEHLLEHALRYFSDFEARHANIIGTIKNCVNKPIEAEYYYLRFKENPQPLALVQAHYPLSMLYLRHHKQNKINLEKGKQLLEEAFQYILDGGLNSLDEEERNFYTVFNRNGYGLVMFREGKTREAIELLEWGLETLSSHAGKHFMHKSVILYNICQCYKKLGDYDNAISAYRKLLDIDYAFPEYHLELGLCLLDKGDLAGYRACLNEALSVSPYHADTHYYLSLLKMDEDDLPTAERHAKLAWELTGDDTTAYNYAYIQSLSGQYQDLDRLLPSSHLPTVAGWWVLKAEETLRQSPEHALTLLRQARALFPDHQEIADNIAVLEG